MARRTDRARAGAHAPHPPKDAEPDERPARSRSALRENFESVAVAALFAIFVRAFVAQPYKIPSGSMEQTLLVGDHLVVNKVLYGAAPTHDGPPVVPTRPVRRGDVVIFRPPHDPTQDYIKRVVGLPGETLRLVHDPRRNGLRVYVDGVPLPESYRTRADGPVTEEPGAGWVVDNVGRPAELAHHWVERSYRLGSDEYFMMGDNRNNSQDSRFWEGPPGVAAERIRGKAVLIYWSYDGHDLEPGAGFGERLRHFASIAWHFFSRSRWERSFDRV